MKCLLLLAILLSPPSAVAIYRCEQNGSVTYTDFPCDGRRIDITRSVPPAQDSGDHLKNERREVGRLQKMREQRERQDMQIRDLAARGAAARDRKCRSLALQLKWREEDARETTLDKAQHTRKQLRRAQEKFDAECR